MSSASVIAQKPLSELSLGDLESLVEIEAAESDQLELKRDLPISNDAKGWRESGKLHKNETRAIAIEVVALANAYGGRVYIGIDESSDDPKRAARMASALPNVASLSERLGDGLNGLISPPIRGLALKAIADAEGSGDGFWSSTCRAVLRRLTALAYLRNVIGDEDQRRSQWRCGICKTSSGKPELGRSVSASNSKNQFGGSSSCQHAPMPSIIASPWCQLNPSR